MSEKLEQGPTPQQRVFGDAFSLQDGVANQEVQDAFFAERISQLKTEESGWMPRILDDDFGVAADLFKDKKLVATIDYEYEIQQATVFVTTEEDGPQINPLVSDVSLDEAIETAEAYASLV